MHFFVGATRKQYNLSIDTKSGIRSDDIIMND
jgi:hypothetical protein